MTRAKFRRHSFGPYSNPDTWQDALDHFPELGEMVYPDDTGFDPAMPYLIFNGRYWVGSSDPMGYLEDHDFLLEIEYL